MCLRPVDEAEPVAGSGRLGSVLAHDIVGLRSHCGQSLVNLLQRLAHERRLLDVCKLELLSHRAHGLHKLSDCLRVLSSRLGLQSAGVVECKGVWSLEERWTLGHAAREGLIKLSALVLFECPVDFGCLLQSVRMDGALKNSAAWESGSVCSWPMICTHHFPYLYPVVFLSFYT